MENILKVSINLDWHLRTNHVLVQEIKKLYKQLIDVLWEVKEIFKEIKIFYNNFRHHVSVKKFAQCICNIKIFFLTNVI